MSFRILPRVEIGLPTQPTNMNGSPRPALAKGRDGLAVHYVGAGAFRRREANEAILAIEQFARSPQKETPFEYNYMIGQQDDLLVHEYAGHFRAAHSRGNNNSFFGVCLLNGVDENPTNRQIEKVRWLRHELTANGWIRPDGVLLPHQQMPGQVGATSCPGDRIMKRWDDLERPWGADDESAVVGIGRSGVVDAPGEPPATPGDDGCGHHLVREGESARSIALAHFGSEERAVEIEAANGGRIPAAGQRCAVPGVEGAWVTVEDGWGPFSCIRAAGTSPSGAAVERFWRWNGGDSEAGQRGPLLAGEAVWVEFSGGGGATTRYR